MFMIFGLGNIACAEAITVVQLAKPTNNRSGRGAECKQSDIFIACFSSGIVR
jgi:hypothetical protein